MRNWDKIFSLIKKTNDKYIFEFQNEDLIVMKLGEYDRLVDQKDNIDDFSQHDLSEEELIEKINEDIANWRENQATDSQEAFDFVSAKELAPESPDNENEAEAEVEDQYYLEPVD